MRTIHMPKVNQKNRPFGLPKVNQKNRPFGLPDSNNVVYLHKLDYVLIF